jgi:hypothetical protein
LAPFGQIFVGDDSRIPGSSVLLQDVAGVDKFVKQSAKQLDYHRECGTPCFVQIVVCLHQRRMMNNSYSSIYGRFSQSRDDRLQTIRKLGAVCVAGFLDPVVGSDVNKDTLPVYCDPQDPHSMNEQSHIRDGDLVQGSMDKETWKQWLE